MDLELMKSILNENLLSDKQKEHLIIQTIAKSEDVIPVVLKILTEERQQKADLIDDLNRLLSKAHVCLEEPKYNKDNFIDKEIEEFYKSGKIGHCFKNINKKK